jgi:hypothetical protein
MSLHARLTGCLCPVCRGALPFRRTVRLLGDEAMAATVETFPCPSCGTVLRAAGSRWDQTWRLGLLFLPGPVLAWHLFGYLAGFALAVLLSRFPFRVVALEPAS